MPLINSRTYLPLPLGTVMPKGWLKEQLEIQRDGLTGHLEEVWNVVGPDSAWLGGSGENWEIAPYYLDGLVPLAYLLNDGGLKKKAQKWIDWTLANQGATGWLGPATERGDKWWPRAVILKVLAQYAEATGDERVKPAMAKYLMHLYQNLPAEPLFEWAKFRWAEYLLPLLWLCERMECPVFDQLAIILKRQGYGWIDHFRYFKIEGIIEDNPNLATHVVNHAMAVKYPALWSLFSGRQSDSDASDVALAMLDRFHGQATGIFTGDEHLAGKNPSRGTELCAVVEFMYSLETLTSILGKAAYGDRLESVAFNNLPGAFDAEMWAHQYDQQANQVLASIDKRPWTNGDDANIFGLAPHYICCTGNFNQGWPKYVSHMWMGIPKGGLAATAYGPSEVVTQVGGVEIRIEEKTDYPFSGEIEFDIRCSEETVFPLALRIPAWAESAEIVIGKDKPVTPKTGEYHTINRKWKKHERVTLTLPMNPRVTRHYNDSVAIHRGPLTFSLPIEAEWKRIRGEKPAYDYEVYPQSKWNYALALDPDNPGRSLAVETDSVKMPCFDQDRAPVKIMAKARELPGWGMEGASAAAPPKSPAKSDRPLEDVALVPYGSAKLRITEFPLAE